MLCKIELSYFNKNIEHHDSRKHSKLKKVRIRKLTTCQKRWSKVMDRYINPHIPIHYNSKIFTYNFLYEI